MEKPMQLPNIIPAAPGFRIVTCRIEDERADFEESPLIGWLQLSATGFDPVDPIFLDHGLPSLGSEMYGCQVAYRLLHAGLMVTDEMIDWLTKEAQRLHSAKQKAAQ
ncbi:MAG: hypothetical protein LAO22_21275 [Acidobacteriia bacterium]|nr:hypothetical protein [Terriglobia bacterium]